MEIAQSVRLDKWLWAARFFKTRSLATEAIKGGKVHVDGNRVKPGKSAEINQIVTINKSAQKFSVRVIAISDIRGNYDVAQKLYQETAESIALREKESLLRKLAHQSQLSDKGRPTKRNRRKIIKFTNSLDD